MAAQLKPNLIDRAISYVSPATGARRMHARFVMEQAQSVLGGGQGGTTVGAFAESYTSTNSTSGTRYYRPGVRSAAADQSGVLPTLRGQSRDLARNHPLAVGAINTNVDRVVGTGLALSAQPQAAILGWSEDEAKAWKATAQAEFSLFADSRECDITGEQNFYELQALVLRAALESGDCVTVLPDADAPTREMPYRLRLQVLEADRVGNPAGKMDTDQMAGGFEFNAAGRAMRCHIYRSHPGGLNRKADRFAGDWVDLVGATGRRRVLHHYRRLRPEQPRGIPYLAPVIDALKQMGRYTEAEITAAVVSSMFTAFIKTKDGDTTPIFDGAAVPGAGGAGGAGGGAAGGASDEIELGHGAVIGLDKDEDVVFANPSRPNTGFEPFMDSLAKYVGVSLGLPRDLLLKQFNSSYSASKAALLDAWQWLRGLRAWMGTTFCQPVYETWLAEAVAIGRIDAPGFFDDPLLRWAYTRTAWNGDSQGSINPKDEVAAYRDAIDGRLMTHEQAEWLLWGTDFNATVPIKAAEDRALKAANIPPVARAGAGAAPGQGARAAGKPESTESGE